MNVGAPMVDQAHDESVVLARRLESIGRGAGLVRVGFTDVAPFPEVYAALMDRKTSGLSSDMQFTYRNPARSTSPQRILKSARSLVVGAYAYHDGVRSAPAPSTAMPEPTTTPQRPLGRVARYAAGDVYGLLRHGLEQIAGELRACGHRAVVVADSNALVDRAAAHRAGIGWWGRNANLLTPEAGSWVVLGAVATDAILPAAVEPVADGCGTCRRCIDACPTRAIVAPGVVDANRCLAWLVQRSAPIPVEFRAAVGDRLYGCDDCQEVCPPSARAARHSATLTSASGARSQPEHSASTGPGSRVDLLDLLDPDTSDDVLRNRFGAWYLAERNPRYLRRTALVVLGNVADPDDPEVRHTLDHYADGPDPLLADHARWAIDRLDDRRSPVGAETLCSPTAIEDPASRRVGPGRTR